MATRTATAQALDTAVDSMLTALDNVLLQQQIHDDFVGALRRAMENVKPGQMIGPVTTEAQYRKVQDYYRIAREKGLKFRMAVIHAEQPKDYLKKKRAKGQIRPLG